MSATQTSPAHASTTTQRKMPRLSWMCLLTNVLGMGLATLLLLSGIMFLATRNAIAPERALAMVGPVALLICALISGRGAMKAHRIGFFENVIVGVVFLGGILASLGRYLTITDPIFLAPSMVDIAYLANLFGTTLGGPLGGIGVATALIWLASFIGSSLGFLLGGDGKLDLRFGYEVFIARSHLKLRRRSATLLMTFISICGVAVGVLALTVVLSVMGGFEIDLKSKIVGANAHAVVMKYGTKFSEWTEIADKVRGVRGVRGVTPFILNEVMLTSDNNMSGCLLKGIDPTTARQVNDVEANLVEGKLTYLESPNLIPQRQRQTFIDIPNEKKSGERTRQNAPKTDVSEKSPEGELTIEDILRPQAKKASEDSPTLPGIILGKELAHGLRVSTGDKVNVVSPLGGEMGPMGQMPKSRPFRVAGVFYSGMYEFDAKSAYIAIPEAQAFFGMDNSVTGLEVKTDDIDNTRQTTRAILSAIDGYPYRTKDFAEMNKNLFSALRLERLVMAVILGFIVLVACFNIVSTLIMMVLEKGRDIAILKSMGATDTSIMKIFVVEGLIIGTIGTLAGTILGYATCLFVEKFGITLDADVYYMDRLPVVVDPIQFLGVALLALLLSFLATIYPATRASRLKPVDGLRND